MLSQETKEILKSTRNTLSINIAYITLYMYDLVRKDIRINKFFPTANSFDEHLPQKLGDFLIDIIVNLDDLSILQDSFKKISAVHVFHKITPEHYDIIGDHFIKAIDYVLSPSQEVLDAWNEAYQFLAETLINIDNSWNNGD